MMRFSEGQIRWLLGSLGIGCFALLLGPELVTQNEDNTFLDIVGNARIVSAREHRDVTSTNPSLVALDEGYTSCIEILAARNALILRDGKVLLPQPGITSQDLQKVLPGARPMFGEPDVDLLLEMIATGRVHFGLQKRTWPSLPPGDVLPEGKKPSDMVGAPCGIPPGVARLVPAGHGLRLGTAV
jgi:hypothetical protein